MTNLKMIHSGLVECPEVEQRRPCIYFGKGVCPSCYSELQFKMRNRTARHVHNRTPDEGLIRAGTWIEWTPGLWEQFKSGEGEYLCCGERVVDDVGTAVCLSLANYCPTGNLVS